MVDSRMSDFCYLCQVWVLDIKHHNCNNISGIGRFTISDYEEFKEYWEGEYLDKENNTEKVEK